MMLHKPMAVRLWLMGALLCGCGDGFPRTHYSGKVTLDGQAVPTGSVSLTPNGAKGNTGTQGIAEIKDGKYDTSKARGYAGGPTIVSIVGIPPNRPDYILQYQGEIDLPQGGGTHDFDLKSRQVTVMHKGGEP